MTEEDRIYRQMKDAEKVMQAVGLRIHLLHPRATPETGLIVWCCTSTPLAIASPGWRDLVTCPDCLEQEMLFRERQPTQQREPRQITARPAFTDFIYIAPEDRKKRKQR